MASDKTSAVRLTLPMAADQHCVDLAEQEEKRTPASARRDVRAAELLCTVTNMSFEQAEEVLQQAGGMFKLARLPDYALQQLRHVGPKRAKQIRAMTEWSLALQEVTDLHSIQIRTPADLANLVMLEMGLLEREELRVVALDTRNYVQEIHTVYQGSLNAAVVRIAEIFRMPVGRLSASMILVHNHPSGDPTPSPEDVRLTELASKSARDMDVELLDHLIIGQNRFVSMRESRLGFG